MPNINLASVEVNGYDQPIFVPADVENDKVLYFVCRRESFSQFSKTLKFGRFHNLKPSYKCCFAIRMFFPELDQHLAGDDMHAPSLSQFEIFCKPSI